MAKVSKRYKALAEKIENKKYSLADACTSVKELKSAKFDESVEIALNLNLSEWLKLMLLLIGAPTLSTFQELFL